MLGEPGANGNVPPAGPGQWLIPHAPRGEKRAWFLVLTIVPPLLAVIASAPVGLFWVSSASAFHGTEQALAYNLGFWALVLYSLAYFPLLAAAAICMAFSWRLAGLFHTLIWLCFATFALTMLSVLSQLEVL